MKSKLFTLILIGLLAVPMTTSFGFIGFGLTVLQEMGSVDGYEESMTEGISEARFTRDAFENPVGFGGYLYLDFIPVIDLEVDFQVAAATYAFSFGTYASNVLLAETPPDAEFAYARGSFYLTARKKLLGVGVPILGGIKLHAGGGLNFHKTAPYMSIDLMQELLGDELYNDFADQSAMEDKIIKYVEDNLESQTGIHLQAGVQLKLLILDMFVNYRYTIAKDVFEDQSGFGALNFRLGIGF
ncbi:MAG: hypothetical protein H8E14_17390 [Candidatus Marinimicrobia bacterium]|nr:hypothetical protein [Candidatus Neomarinimicrobiota bacterium]